MLSKQLLYLLLITSSLLAKPSKDLAVTFEFISTHEKEVKLAYLFKRDGRKWRFKKMHKNGKSFTVNLDIKDEVWYEFVTEGNIWYRKDPFNQHIKDNHPYLKRNLRGYINIKNRKVYHYSSEHFDLFVPKKKSTIRDLERIYKTLTERHLKMFDNEIKPKRGKKIRYYAGLFKGEYATAGNAAINSKGIYANSHEIIHVLMYQYPHYGPMAEGLAQCFQESGNKKPLSRSKVKNVNLAAKRKYKHIKMKDVLLDFKNHRDYHMAASFVFFHLFAYKKKYRKKFIPLLKKLTRGKTKDDFLKLYAQQLGFPLETGITEWEQWIRKVRKGSKIYTQWNKKI